MTTEVLAAEHNVMDRIGALLVAASIAPAEVRCRMEADGAVLIVHLDLPHAVSRSLEHALAVRVLDALRTAGGPTYGRILVQIHPGPTAA